MERRIGTVAAYDPQGQAARLRLEAPLSVGDRIHIAGARNDIEEVVAGLQVDRAKVAAARPGQEVGVWCPERVQEGDAVYRVEP